ncbi:hypothetical protein BH23CHL10_BH23CHL10_07850 [soil metagenome]
MRRRILPFVLGGALSIAAIAPAAAAPSINSPVGGLVNVIVQVEDSLNDNTVQVLNVDISNSLNRLLQNALQNADIDVLTNSLNNLLRNVDIDVTVTDITVVGDSIVGNLLSGPTLILG